MDNNHFILMADIIGSGKRAGNNLMADFKELTNQIRSDYRKSFISPITITLGDEFQAVTKDVYNSVKIIINIEELIIRKELDFKLRYVLLYGEIETPINDDIAYEMLGEGLTNARRSLGNLKKGDQRFLFNEITNLNNLLNYSFVLYQSIVDKWKIKDYRMIHALINQVDYKDVAIMINRDQSATWRRRKSLEIEQYLASRNLIYEIAKLYPLSQ